MLSHYTRRFGYDTVKLNLDLGSDPTVFPMPSEHLWWADAVIPLTKPADPCQLSMQLKCLEVEARGGGKLDLKSRGLRLWRQQDGVHFEFHRSEHRSELRLECSLPRLLFGHNKLPVPPDLLPDAYAELTRRARLFLGPNLPDVHELEAWRIDATADMQLRSELECALVGRVLADRALNDAMPTRYPTGGSVSWPASKGMPGARCYGKSEQTGDEKIVGRYRAEVQCMGGKQFRKQLAKMVDDGQLDPKWLSGRGRACVKAECLASEPKLCTGLLGALTGICDSAVDFVREAGSMTALEAIDLLEQKAGVNRSRAVQLVGYSHIVRVLGWGFTGLKNKGLWEAKRSFEAAGVNPASIEFSTAEKIGAGAGMVAGGAIAGGLLVAGAVAGSALADALVPDEPSPKKFVEPGPPQVAAELGKVA